MGVPSACCVFSRPAPRQAPKPPLMQQYSHVALWPPSARHHGKTRLLPTVSPAENPLSFDPANDPLPFLHLNLACSRAHFRANSIRYSFLPQFLKLTG